MSTVKTSVDDEQIKIWIEVVSELCSKAPNAVVRDCLRQYDPTKSSAQIKCLLKRCQKESLQRTIEFLGGSSEHLIKDQLIESIILRVQSLFPEICQLWNESYCISLEDKSFIACSSCGQEIHRKCYIDKLKKLGLYGENNNLIFDLLDIPGFHFLCGLCGGESMPKNLFNKNPNKVPEQLSLSSIPIDEPNNGPPNTYDYNVNLTDQSESVGLNSYDVTLSQNSVNIQSHEFRDISYDESPQKKKQDKKSTNFQRSLINVDNHEQVADKGHHKKKKTCKFYVNGNCRFGISGRKNGECKFDHPKACSKLLKHGTHATLGCNKGKHCSNYHPKMCFSSLKSKECTDISCKYVHVKGTQTKKQHLQSKIPQNSTNETSCTEHNTSQVTNTNTNSNTSNSFLEMFHCLIEAVETRLDQKLSIMNNAIKGLFQQQQTPQNYTQNPWIPQPAQMQQPPIVRYH